MLPFDPASNNDPFVLLRSKLLAKIMTAEKRLLVNAPPGGGKTSLANLLMAHLKSKGIRTLYRMANPGPGAVERMVKKPMKCLNELLGGKFEEVMHSAAVVILDDAQGLFPAQGIWDTLVNEQHRSQARIIFLASVTPESCDAQTPVINGRIGWGHLKLDNEEQDELCAKLIAHFSDLPWFPEIMAMVRRDAGSHVGLLRLVPHHLVNNVNVKDDDVELLRTHVQRFYFGEMFDTWQMLRFFFPFHSQLNDTQRAVLREIILRGGVAAPGPFDPNESLEVKAKRDLLRMVIVVQEGPTLEFATPLHQRYFFRAAFPALIDQEAFQRQVKNLPDWLSLVIGRFPQSCFTPGASAELPLETALQHVFWQAASECLPSSYHLATEVSQSMEGDKKSEGRLDFWVDKPQWAIELARDGHRQQEHLDRFGADGKYYCLRPKEWCVLDFRHPGTNINQLQGKPNLTYVVFAPISLMRRL